MLIIFSLVGLIVLLGAILFFQPRSLLSIAANSTGVVFFASPSTKAVALTIDDGPYPETTNKILQILAQYQVPATFFLISSRVAGNEEVVTEMVNQGHEIGNHFTQDELSIKLSPEEFTADLLTAEQVLINYTSQLHWLRPGGGWYNRTMVEIAHNYNYRVVLGSVFPYDTHIKFSWFAPWHILTHTQPGDIIILHDGKKDRGERTVATLEQILPQLQEQGYGFLTLSQLMKIE